MENQQIKRLAVILAVILGILVIVATLHGRSDTAKSPLGQINYTDAITGVHAVYYANKGLETQPLRVSFGGNLQNALSGERYDDTVVALTVFVNSQSHYRSHNPEITAIHGGGNDYTFKLFIESSEMFYAVHLTFDSQQIPHLTYEVTYDTQV